MSKYLLLIVSIALLASCDSKKDDYYHVVEYSIENTKTKEAANDTIVDAVKTSFDKIFKDAYIALYKSDSISILSGAGNFAFGTYKNTDNKLLEIKIANIGLLELIATQEKGENILNKIIVLDGKFNDIYRVKILIKDDKTFYSKTKDLLSYSENKWRLKSADSLSTDQIKQKVIHQIDYMIKYFELIEEQELGSFQVQHFNSPLKFYSNGIGLKRYETETFKDLFVTESEMLKALDYYGLSIESMTAYPADKDSYTKGYSNALKEMKQYLRVSTK